jgi:hypothetical protein
MINDLVIRGVGRRAGKGYEGDAELLRLAAKAAGAVMSDYPDRTPNHWTRKHGDGIWREWAPLEQDADADRLAVSLGAVVEEFPTYIAVRLDDMLCVETIRHDAAAARRRAIVGVAAMRSIQAGNHRGHHA